MPTTTILDIPQPEQAQMLAALRRARYGYLLALHILLLCAAGRHPTAIAAVLFCSRSSVYRIVRLYRAGDLVPLHSSACACSWERHAPARRSQEHAQEVWRKCTSGASTLF
jgi:hypothetical protein